jgi:hypothetical protein
VFSEAAPFRGKLKDYSHSIFLRYYSTDALGLDADIPGQLDYQQNISRNVDRLIGKSSEFHYGPLDAMVSFLTINYKPFSSRFPGKEVEFLSSLYRGSLC